MLYLKTRFLILLTCILCLTALSVAEKIEDKVTIGKPEIDNLFAAQYRYYKSQSAGNVSIKNNTNKDLYAETSVTVTEYAPKPFTTTTSLPANKTTQVPLRIDFDFYKLPKKGGPVMLDAEIEVNVYSENRLSCQKRLSAKFQLFNLYKLPDGPPEAMAVFVDANDKSVAKFVQKIKGEKFDDNSEIAQRLFELMQKAKIMCMKQTAETVNYPRDVLHKTIGNSYDCALLYAALLENSNVPVALMASDVYILVLFQQKEQIERKQQKEFVLWKGKYWTAIDIRMIEETFADAKGAGMLAYEGLKQEGKVKPFILRETWKQYKPVRFIPMQTFKEIQQGITYVQRGKFDKAEQIFRRHLYNNARAAAYNNLGNISFRHDNFRKAEEFYLRALKVDHGDGAIYLNLGIMYAFVNEDKKAQGMFDRAFRELGSYAQMCHALGIECNGIDHKKVRLLLRKAEERVLKNRTRPLGVRELIDNKLSPLYWKRR